MFEHFKVCCLLAVLEIAINDGMYITAIFILNTVKTNMNRLMMKIKNYLKKYVSCGTINKEHSLRLVKRLCKKHFSGSNPDVPGVQKCALFSFYQYLNRWLFVVSGFFISNGKQ